MYMVFLCRICTIVMFFSSALGDTMKMNLFNGIISKVFIFFLILSFDIYYHADFITEAYDSTVKSKLYNALICFILWQDFPAD